MHYTCFVFSLMFFVCLFFVFCFLLLFFSFSMVQTFEVVYISEYCCLCYVKMVALQLFYDHLMDRFIPRQIMSGSDIYRVTMPLPYLAFVRL